MEKPQGPSRWAGEVEAVALGEASGREEGPFNYGMIFMTGTIKLGLSITSVCLGCVEM